MKVVGIVAEYNPFHNGHQYHIEETKKQTGADYVIAVMSGDFVQRGAPAFLDKYERTRAALKGGCDLVLELPVIYSSASAEFFAGGAIHLLNGLGLCDSLSFGSEEGSLDALHFLAELLTKEPEEYKESLRYYLKSGLSFPVAREKAILQYLTNQEIIKNDYDLAAFLKGSNNILGLEYLKALKKTGSSIVPATILRKNAGYHDNRLYDHISSASAIRHHLHQKEDSQEVAFSVPEETYLSIQRTLDQAGQFPDFDQLTPYLHSKLLVGSNPAHYLDWDKDLANRLQQLPWQTMTYTQIGDHLKSRNITHSRIHRALLHFILEIEQERFMKQYESDPVPYGRILGFRKESSPLIKEINKKGQLPLITKPAHIHNVLSQEDSWVWEKDLAASKLYQSIQACYFNRKLPSAYERNPIIL